MTTPIQQVMTIHWWPHRFICRNPMAAAIRMVKTVRISPTSKAFSPGPAAPPTHSSL